MKSKTKIMVKTRAKASKRFIALDADGETIANFKARTHAHAVNLACRYYPRFVQVKQAGEIPGHVLSVDSDTTIISRRYDA